MSFEEKLKTLLLNNLNEDALNYKFKEEKLEFDSFKFRIEFNLKKDTHIKFRLFETPLRYFFEIHVYVFEISKSKKTICEDFTSFYEDQIDKIKDDRRKIYQNLFTNITNYINSNKKPKHDEPLKDLPKINNTKPILTEVKKQEIQVVFICRITVDRYIEVRKNIETNTLKSFNLNFKDFSRSIFSYWYGAKNKTPASLIAKYSKSNIDLENIKDNLYYYQIKFEIEDDKDLINLLTNKNPREREKGLEILSDKNINYQYSELFNELPDDCIMV